MNIMKTFHSKKEEHQEAAFDHHWTELSLHLVSRKKMPLIH